MMIAMMMLRMMTIMIMTLTLMVVTLTMMMMSLTRPPTAAPPRDKSLGGPGRTFSTLSTIIALQKYIFLTSPDRHSYTKKETLFKTPSCEKLESATSFLVKTRQVKTVSITDSLKFLCICNRVDFCLLEFSLYSRSRPCFSLYLYLCPYVYLYLCAAAPWQTGHSCRVHTPPLLLAELKTAGSVCRSTSPPGNTQVFYFIFIILRILLHKTWLCNFFRNIHGRWFMFICVSFCAKLGWLIDETFYIKFCLKGSQS